MSTDLQKLAQKENYALFVLTGMLSNLIHIKQVLDVEGLRYQIQTRISNIKAAQYYRKKARNEPHTEI